MSYWVVPNANNANITMLVSKKNRSALDHALDHTHESI